MAPAKWAGRAAMLALAGLALHADVTSGLIHEFLQRPTALPRHAAERGRDASLHRDAAAAARRGDSEPWQSFAFDVVLQDAP